MKEACMKFEALEEEHLAQMSTFMLKLARVGSSTCTCNAVHKYMHVHVFTLRDRFD